MASFPALNFSNGTGFDSSWRSNAFTSFPSVDFSSATTFRDAWIYSNLTTYPANQFDTTGTLASNAFQGAWFSNKLTAQSIENIITSLDTNGQQNIFLQMNSGQNANASTWSTDAIIAHTNLINKGWTINQNGTPSMSDLEYTINTSGTFTLRSGGQIIRLTGVMEVLLKLVLLLLLVILILHQALM